MRALGPYELIEELGRGGCGVVYKARDTRLDRFVAIKVLESSDPDEQGRFLREARTAGRLRHPNIVAIHDVGEDDGLRYFAMDLIEGRTLESETLPPRRALEIILDAARAVHYAHEQGVVHRDLKPGNILLTREGTPVVTDFGLAREVDSKSLRTLSGTVLGTPAYMSPEQASGRARCIDARSDVYSLGATLYECLAGSPPFRGETAYDVLLRVMQEDPPPFRLHGVNVHADIETVVMKCLEKDPARRYPTAAALADDLDRFLRGEPIEAQQIGTLTRLARKLRRHPILAGTVALGAAAALLAVIGFGLRGAREEVVKRREARLFIDRANQALERARAVLRTKSDLEDLFQQATMAATETQRALEISPLHEEAHRIAGDAWSLAYWVGGNDERYAAAEREYRRALEIAPEYAGALLGLGELKLRRHHRLDQGASVSINEYGASRQPLIPHPESSALAREAEELFARALPSLQAAGSGEAAYARAVLALAPGDHRACIEAATEGIRAGGSQVEMLHWIRAIAHERLNEWEAALSDYKAAIGFMPNMPYLRSAYAYALLSVGRTDDAIDEFKEAYDQWSIDGGTILGLASSLTLRWRKMGDKQDLVQADRILSGFIQALEEGVLGPNPDTLPLAYCNRGHTRVRMERPAEARRDLERALQIRPDHVPSLTNLAIVEGLEGNPARAKELLERAQALQPDDPGIHSNLGETHLKLGAPEQAIRCYDRAIELDERIAQAWFGRGRARAMMNDLEAAEKDMSEAIRRAPDVAPLYYYRGDVRARRGIHREAIADMDEAVRRGHRHASCFAGRAQLRGMLWNLDGRPEEQRAAVLAANEEDGREALRLDPQNASAHHALGIVHLEREGWAESIAELEKALALDPSRERILRPLLEKARRNVEKD